MRLAKTLSAAGLIFMLGTGSSMAAQLAFEGFETGTGDWTNTTQTASGGGPLGVPAYAGSFYGTVHNDDNTYLPGYGAGGYSFFGFSSTPAYPGSAFTQSMAVYIDTTLAPVNPGSQAFWIDMSPGSSNPFDVTNNGGIGYGGEHNFRLAYNGGSVTVSADGNLAPSTTLTDAGWYLFNFTYAKGATDASLSTTDLQVLTGSGTVLSSDTFLNDSPGGPLLSQDLAGPGYAWLTVWQNGFSGDNLAIDNVQAFTADVPEPLTISLFAAGLVGAGALRRKKAQKA